MSADELEQVITEIREICDQLEHGVLVPRAWDNGGTPISFERSPTGFGLLNLASAATADGFPTRSLSDGGGRSSVLDDQGDAMPPVNDPTGELATELAEGRGLNDSIRYHRDSFVRGLTGALGDLKLARHSLGQLVDLGETSPGDQGCRVHAKYFPKTIPAPVYRSGRCRWCYEFSLAEGIDPPEAVLQRREEGGKLDETFVAAAIADERRARRKSNKKRRGRR